MGGSEEQFLEPEGSSDRGQQQQQKDDVPLGCELLRITLRHKADYVFSWWTSAWYVKAAIRRYTTLNRPLLIQTLTPELMALHVSLLPCLSYCFSLLKVSGGQTDKPPQTTNQQAGAYTSSNDNVKAQQNINPGPSDHLSPLPTLTLVSQAASEPD